MKIFRLFRRALAAFVQDDAISLGAALAFYSALSLAPLLVILIWIGTLLGKNTQNNLTAEIVSLVGPEAGSSVQSIIEHSQEHPELGSMSGIISLVMLFVGATGVFAQLQHSLNWIWKVEAKPNRGVWNWTRRRLLSMGMVLVIGFLLLISLVVSAVLSSLLGQWFVVDGAVSLMIFTLLFALIFKYMPDVLISWADVWVGSLLTASFFAIGKFAIGLYLGRSSIGSTYGAAGSLIVLLAWVYYSSLIFFFGAELTQVWARSAGRAIQPNGYAQPRKGDGPASRFS